MPPPKDPSPVTMTVTIQPRLVARVEAYAKRERRNKSNAVSVLLEDALNAADHARSAS